jgi:SAM-dependent methyltransferase
MSHISEYARRLLEAEPLRRPLLRTIIQSLPIRPGSRGLDAGCGIGLQALLLADAVGPAGHVTGVDFSTEFLRHGQAIASEAGLADRVSFREGNIDALPFTDDTFDWAWSADCIGYPAGDMLTPLRELARVVVPGGPVAVLAWSSQCLLPGHPLLEARLNATCSALAPHVAGEPPESHFLRGLRWFHEAGLVDATATTHVGSVQAPLDEDMRTALVSLFEMLWEKSQQGARAEDIADYERLCRPDSSDCILDLPEYHAFFTYTLFRGRVAA